MSTATTNHTTTNVHASEPTTVEATDAAQIVGIVSATAKAAKPNSGTGKRKARTHDGAAPESVQSSALEIVASLDSLTGDKRDKAARDAQRAIQRGMTAEPQHMAQWLAIAADLMAAMGGNEDVHRARTAKIDDEIKALGKQRTASNKTAGFVKSLTHAIVLTAVANDRVKGSKGRIALALGISNGRVSQIIAENDVAVAARAGNVSLTATEKQRISRVVLKDRKPLLADLAAGKAPAVASPANVAAESVSADWVTASAAILKSLRANVTLTGDDSENLATVVANLGAALSLAEEMGSSTEALASNV